MKFYDVLSKYYDVIFPFSSVKKEFLIDEFEGKKKILDAACGSGTYSIELAKESKQVLAIDLDEKMVELINDKQTQGLDMKARVMDMTKITELNEKFDGIFCIGNSLVHLSSKEEIGEFIMSCYERLNEGGKLVVQIINYDKIFKENLKGLPTITRENEGLNFRRDYIPMRNGNIEFKGTIELSGGESFENSVELVPITKNELEGYLDSFKRVNFYGGFNKSPWSLNNMPTVFVAEK